MKVMSFVHYVTFFCLFGTMMLESNLKVGFYYRSIAALHESSFVHADLKPANIMWSSYDGCFKLLDFGLTFHTEETDLHQIQSSGKYSIFLGSKIITF